MSSSLPPRWEATPCFSAVPINTPVFVDGLSQPIPSAGPHYVGSNAVGQQLVLRRNPGYGGERPQQVDAVVIKEGLSPDEAVRQVEVGKADYAADDFLPGLGEPSDLFRPGGRLDLQYGDEGTSTTRSRSCSGSCAGTRLGVTSDCAAP